MIRILYLLQVFFFCGLLEINIIRVCPLRNILFTF